MPNSPTRTSTSASTDPSQQAAEGGALFRQLSYAEFYDLGATPPAAEANGASLNGSSAEAAPATSRPAAHKRGGARIPIPLSATSPMSMTPDEMQAALREMQQGEESVEDRVFRLRPRSLRLQLRYLYTLAFMFWLFGRLIFWQVYVAQYFRKWVARTNERRFVGYAREFRKFAVRMGGVMIKAGQFASTRADVMPETVIRELESLQDQVPSVPYADIQAVLDRELGIKQLEYSFFDKTPIAAASLGQVHRAQLKTGEKVVVKVQRPNVRDLVYTDLAAMFIVAQVAMRFSFVRRRADAVQLIEEFGRVLLEEVSYTNEIKNAARFRQMYTNDPGVYVPTTYDHLCTDQVITIEDVTSIKIDDYEALAAAGIDRTDVANRLMDTYLLQIFEHRFFHADPHPGNLFVYPLPVDDVRPYLERGGRPYLLIFIDFGMTGSLTPELVQGLINTLTAIITRDARRLVQSYKDLGFLLPDADTKRMEEATKAVFDQVWGLSMTDMASIDFDTIANIGKEFSDLIRALPFRVPQDFIYLGRTVAILTGMATKLDPTFNPWSTIQDNMTKLITTNEDMNIFTELSSILLEPFNALINGGPQGFVRSVQMLVQRFQRISRTQELLEQLVSGEVQIETRLSVQHRRQLERIEAQGKRTTRAFLFGSLLITSTMFYTSGDTTLATLGYISSAIAFLAFLWARS